MSPSSDLTEAIEARVPTYDDAIIEIARLEKLARSNYELARRLEVERLAVLDEQEQAVMDELLSVMDTIQNEWGMQSNGSELASAIHVLQGFVIQHMLHRLAPEKWSGWR